MKEPNRQRKTEIKAISAVQLNDEQKEAKRLIVENQIVVVTGMAWILLSAWNLHTMKSKIEKVRPLTVHFIRNNKLAKLAKNTTFDKSLFKIKK
jgi:hypothetical protein